MTFELRFHNRRKKPGPAPILAVAAIALLALGACGSNNNTNTNTNDNNTNTNTNDNNTNTNTNDNNTTYDLTFSGTGFSPHEGQTLHAALIRTDNGNIRETDSATVTGGAFSFSWPNSLEAGKSYRIDYYADVDGSGFCEAGTDHMWRVEIPAVMGDVNQQETHSVNFTEAACDSFDLPQTFDLTFEGTGYTPHEGQTLHVAVFEDGGSTPVQHDSATVSNGEFSFTWANLLKEGSTYTVDFYADVNGDGFCEAGTDHMWRSEIAAVMGDVTQQETHNVNFTEAACDSFGTPQTFDLAFEGTGYTPHEGQTLHVAVFEDGGMTPVQTDSATISNGEFSFLWAGLLHSGSTYRIDFYADVNGNGQCETSTDHRWRVEIPAVMGDVTQQETHNVNFEDAACDSF